MNQTVKRPALPVVYHTYPGRGVTILHFTTPIPAVGPTQSPTQYALRALSLGINRLQREMDSSTPIDEV
jgi:hypothetical protein